MLIFDLEERLLYSNTEAMNIMPIPSEAAFQEVASCLHVPEEVLGVLKKLKENSTKYSDYECIERNCVVVDGIGNPCALRAFHMGHDAEKKNPTHIIVIVERIAETHEPYFNKAKLEFDLSIREVDVLRFICVGSALKPYPRNCLSVNIRSRIT